MEQVAEPFGLTRESVRQITNRVTDRLLQLPGIPRAELVTVSRLIGERVPIEKEKMAAILVEKGWWVSGRNLTALVAAIHVFLGAESDSDQIIEIHESGRSYLVKRSQQEWPKNILSAAHKLVTHNGAARVSQVAKVFSLREGERLPAAADATSEASADVGEGLVRDLLESADCLWLGEGKDWFTLLHASRNRVINRLAKMFAFYESALVVDVSEALKRSLQKNQSDVACLLPVDILSDLINALPNYTVDQGVVTCASPADTDRLLASELAIARHLATVPLGVSREKELEDAVINVRSRRENPEDAEPTKVYVRDLEEGEEEVNEYSFAMALNFSPLLLPVLAINEGDAERVRGHYRLVGRPRKAA